MAGHAGMVGSAICRRLRQAGYHNLILRTRGQVDLRDAAAVKFLFEAERPAYGLRWPRQRWGGILANSTQPAEFIFDNLSIQTNVIDAAGIAIDDIGLRRPTLDDVFLALTGHAAEEKPDDEGGEKARRRRRRAA